MLPLPSRTATQMWLRRGLALTLCIGIAVLAEIGGRFAPLVGAPLFAIAIGVLITNAAPALAQEKSLRMATSDTSKLCLKGGIVLLGASLDLGDIVQTGLGSLPLLAVTMASGLLCALWLGKSLEIDWRMRCLIGIGTTICGASAIAALAPVIRAKAEEIAYSITVVFFFNMVAVFTFPALGHLLRLTDNGFGDMGWDRGERHFGSRGRRLRVQSGRWHNGDDRQIDPHHPDHSAGTGLRTGIAIPGHPGGRCLPIAVDARLCCRPELRYPLCACCGANTVGLIGSHSMQVQLLGRLVMVVALAAVGLQGHWRAFVGAGSRPLRLGLATWIVVAMSSLAMQTWTQAL